MKTHTFHPCNDILSLGYGQLIQVRIRQDVDHIAVVVDVARAAGGMVVARVWDSIEQRFGPARNVRAEEIRRDPPALSPVQYQRLIDAAPLTVRQMLLMRRAA